MYGKKNVQKNKKLNSDKKKSIEMDLEFLEEKKDKNIPVQNRNEILINNSFQFKTENIFGFRPLNRSPDLLNLDDIIAELDYVTCDYI